MQNHYFIGISVPSFLVAQADRFRSNYDLQAHYKVIPQIEDFHVTLLYLGAVPNEQLAPLISTLRDIAADHPSFPLHIDGLSYFGSAPRPRVVYLEVRQTPPLSALRHAVATRVTKQLGLPFDDRFSPHITIAKKLRSKEGPQIEKERIEPVEIDVPTFSLFTVHPKSSPKYEPVETFEMRARD